MLPMPLSFVRDIMEKNILSVHPETPLLEAYQILEDHRFDGLPVVDGHNRLVGILTEYDLIANGPSPRLSTFQKIFTELDISNKNHPESQDGAASLDRLAVRDLMNPNPLTFTGDATIEEAVAVFREHHRVNPIPVIAPDRSVIGIISRYDVLKFFDRYQHPSQK